MMTQAELAAVLGVSKRSLQDYEAGVSLPQFPRRRRLLDALKILDGMRPC